MNPPRCFFLRGGGRMTTRSGLIFIAVTPYPNAKCAYVVFWKANRILNEEADHLHSSRPTYFFSVYREARDGEPWGGQRNAGLALLRCRALLSTYKQCTTVRPSPPLYSSCHLSTWRMSFKKERLDTGVSLYMGQPRNWNCCTIRYPSWGCGESGNSQGGEGTQASFTGGIPAG